MLALRVFKGRCNYDLLICPGVLIPNKEYIDGNIFIYHTDLASIALNTNRWNLLVLLHGWHVGAVSNAIYRIYGPWYTNLHSRNVYVAHNSGYICFIALVELHELKWLAVGNLQWNPTTFYYPGEYAIRSLHRKGCVSKYLCGFMICTEESLTNIKWQYCC